MRPFNTRIVFMGTPEFAVAPLKALHDAGIVIAGVVTAPDKPAGRGKKLQISAVKEYALANLSCPVFQPDKLKDPDFVHSLKALNAQMFIVVAFRMLPEIVWEIPPKGTINLHASLLPQYRGAAPINWSIINGETETGLTTFLIEKEIDTGKILLQAEVLIAPEDNAGTLHDKLMETGSELLLKTITHISTGNIEAIEQSKFKVHSSELKTAPKIFKEDCKINWSKGAVEVHNLIRGLSPFPGAFTLIRLNQEEATNLKIFESKPINRQCNKPPGTILSDNSTYLHISTGNGILEILQLQMAGKKRISTGEFLRGFHKDINGIILE